MRESGRGFESFEASHSPEKFKNNTEAQPGETCDADATMEPINTLDFGVRIDCSRCDISDVIRGYGSDSEGMAIARARQFVREECKKWKEISSGRMPDSFLPQGLEP